MFGVSVDMWLGEGRMNDMLIYLCDDFLVVVVDFV